MFAYIIVRLFVKWFVCLFVCLPVCSFIGLLVYRKMTKSFWSIDNLSACQQTLRAEKGFLPVIKSKP